VSIATAARKIARRPAKATVFHQPVPVRAVDLEALGTYRGRRFYRHPDLGELEYAGTYGPDAELPNLAIVTETDADGRETFTGYASRDEGTYADLSSAPVRAPRPKPAHRPVDAIGGAALAARKPERIIGAGVSTSLLGPAVRRGDLDYIDRGEPPAIGPAALIARLAKAGATVTLDATSEHLVVTSSGGRPGPGVRELVTAAGPLLVAYLRGEPMTCTVSRHKPPAEAVTIALGGAPWCGQCRPEGS
jgi:hypothetical protein